jgi:hypothetical protein
MSHYQDLCVLAAKYSKQFHDHADACRRLAAHLIEEYATYLACPLEQVEQVELDRSLKPSEHVAPLTERLRVITDPEGFVHFAWRIKFDQGSYRYGANELITFGLHIAGEVITIREERDFSVSSDRSSWLPFFEYLHQQSQLGFSVPYGERSNRIGFFAPK